MRQARSGPWGPPALVIAYFASAVALFHWLEGWSHLNCFYFAVQVLTTVGYGDLAPSTRSGKLATCFYALAGVALVMATVEQLLSRVAGNGFIRVAKKRLFGGDANTGDLLDPNTLLAHKRADLRMLRRTCVGMLLIGCFDGRLILGLEDWVDCLYYSVTTVTTVGLGDVTPSTPLSRFFTALLSLLMVPLFASMLCSYIDLQGAVTGFGKELVRVKDNLSADRLAALAHFKVEMQSTSSLTTWVTREDFLVFTLVQNGVVSKEDVRMVWDDFGRLDHDGDGLIDVNDLKKRISQSPTPSTSDLQPFHA